MTSYNANRLSSDQLAGQAEASEATPVLSAEVGACAVEGAQSEVCGEADQISQIYSELEAYRHVSPPELVIEHARRLLRPNWYISTRSLPDVELVVMSRVIPRGFTRQIEVPEDPAENRKVGLGQKGSQVVVITKNLRGSDLQIPFLIDEQFYSSDAVSPMELHRRLLDTGQGKESAGKQMPTGESIPEEPGVRKLLRSTPFTNLFNARQQRILANIIDRPTVIAEKLGVSSVCVGNALREMREKTGIGSTIGLALRAADEKAISLEELSKNMSVLSEKERKFAIKHCTTGTHNEMAAIEGVSNKVISNRWQKIYRKLGVKRRLQVALVAFRDGYITVEGQPVED